MIPEIQKLIAQGALFACNNSAGKDSQAMFLYLREVVPAAQLIVIHAHLPGVEWDGVVEHIMEMIGDTPYYEVKAGKTFLGMVEARGMWPAAKYRQCTSDLKRGPIQKKLRAIMKERGATILVNCMGLRGEESSARAKKEVFKKSEGNSKAGREWFDWLPIHHWTKEEVFAKIAACGQKPHWAYGAGMSRLSCCFCIMAGKKDLETAARLNPKLLQRYVALEKKIGHTFIAPGKSGELVYLDQYLGIPQPEPEEFDVEHLSPYLQVMIDLKK